MRLPSRSARIVGAAWLVLLGIYVCISVWIPSGLARIASRDVFFCVLPLLVNACLLVNAVTPELRKKAFWMLLALGCTLWLAGQTVWTYVEVYQHLHIPDLFAGDIVFFLHTVPMIAALTMQPHKRSNDRVMLYGYVDFGLLLAWWLYLYVFAVVPWQFVVSDSRQYIQSHQVISGMENLVFAGGAAMLAVRAEGYWRRIYAHVAAAGAVYTVGLVALDLAADRSTYSRGGLYDLPLVISFLWLGTAGLLAYKNREDGQKLIPQAGSELSPESAPGKESRWASRLARMALLSLPLIGFWCMTVSEAPLEVHQFRILVTLGAVLPLGFLAFLRHELVDRERLRLLRASQESLDNLKRLQMHFVQSEKLASIGQLVGGAAHEINNPLTAILGYSELLADDPSAGEKTRSLAEKIREQTRRTKTLVNNLLSFARQVPREQRAPLDINSVVNASVQFRRFDLRGRNIRIEVQTGVGIPEVRADMNQLLQVFTNIINNAVDAMDESGGGTLTVRTMFEKGDVVILFSDTGPGIREPHLVFDPFYTTKPVGKGTGLGLSICYGLVQDQGGQISCYNRPEGGATFRVELPAVPAAFPYPPRSITPAPRDETAKLA
ncbi:MAG TPA: HAMP domain-containing sensor histidine kinase [Candidatus Acidoferrales bacterium]|nr:HAMP domain-containing sensor histidine kinase [Candidatus Acidoferrales bacterium]